jgi:hypothetical protein
MKRGTATQVVCLFLLLAGCSRNRPPLLGVNASQRALITQSTDQLRAAFNQGACQDIYDRADAVFRLAQDPEAWMTQCEQMRKTLGAWQRFEPQLRGKFGIPLTVVASGPAVFGAGDYRVVATWHLNSGRAQLFSLFLKGGGFQMRIPPPATPIQHWSNQRFG